MGSSLEFHFPPLTPSPSILGSTPNHPSTIQPNVWVNLLKAQPTTATSTKLSYFESVGPSVIVPDDEVESSEKEWSLSLVGYAIGKRPFYGALLAAIKRKWQLSGTFDLLSMSDDFFLFKFSTQQDYDTVFNGGPCFLNGKPFIFKKCSWDFRTEKIDCSDWPLWIKLPKLPLVCWTEKCLSMIGSKIGTPIALDDLIARKTRLTFARICILVNPKSPLQSSIPITIKGSTFDQEVLYDWKPSSCPTCNTFTHYIQNYPMTNPKPISLRGRSISRHRGKPNFPTSAKYPNTNHLHVPKPTPRPTPPVNPTPISQRTFFPSLCIQSEPPSFFGGTPG